MSESVGTTESIQNEAVPDAIIDRRRRRSSQLIWLIPIIAMIVGLSLAVRAYMEKGPVITISFKSGEGIEAGKTKIKYKDVQIGLVKSVTIAKDRKSILVSADIIKNAEDLLKEDTRFWVVRPRITGSSITGLGTLTSGSYIGMDAGNSAVRKTVFSGLEIPPAVTMDVPGRQFILHTSDVGSLSVGSPLFYRHVQTGEVISSELDPDGETVTLKVFVRSPFDKYVRQNTLFWQASGIDFKLDANGMKINTESMLSIVMGGIAFQIPDNAEDKPQAENNRHFILFEDKELAMKQPDSVVENYTLIFRESVRGLVVGAPVDLRGVTVGEVSKIDVKLDSKNKKVAMAVRIRFYPERLKSADSNPSKRKQGNSHNLLETMVRNGFRAQLKNSSLLTGQLYVALDFFPEAPLAKINWSRNPPELPTIAGSMAQLQASLMRIAHKLEKLPLDELAGDVRKTVQTLDVTLKSADSMLKNIDSVLAPEARQTLADLRATLNSADKALKEVKETMSADSPLQVDLRETMQEIGKAAKTMRLLGDYLERNPEALIQGKQGDKP